MQTLNALLEVPKGDGLSSYQEVSITTEEGINWEMLVLLERTYGDVAGAKLHEVARHLNDEGILTHSEEGSYFFTEGFHLHRVVGYDFSEREDAENYKNAYNGKVHPDSPHRTDLGNRLKLVQRLED